MKLNKPVMVDLFKFIAYGEFDYIKLGQSSEWIFNNFPDPDSISDAGHHMYIWQYGNIEFHFKGDILILIYCDNFIDFNAGSHIALNKWIFEKTIFHTLSNVITQLNQNKISFTLFHNTKLENVMIRILTSHVDIHFDLANQNIYENSDETMFVLSGFGLMDENYRQKF